MGALFRACGQCQPALRSLRDRCVTAWLTARSQLLASCAYLCTGARSIGEARLCRRRGVALVRERPSEGAMGTGGAYQLRFRFGDAGRRRMRKARSRAASDRVCSWFRSRRQRPGRRALAGFLPQGCGRDVRRPQVQLRVAESPVRKVRTLGSMHGDRKRGQGGDRGTGTMAKAAGISLPLRPQQVRLASALLASWER